MTDQEVDASKRGDLYVWFGWISFLIPILSILFLITVRYINLGPFVALFAIIPLALFIGFVLGIASLIMQIFRPKGMGSATIFVLAFLGVLGCGSITFILIGFLSGFRG